MASACGSRATLARKPVPRSSMRARFMLAHDLFPTCLRPPKRQAKRRTVPRASRRRETGIHFSGSCAVLRFAQALRRVERRRHDGHVAGATAQMPGEERADVGLARVRIVAQIIVE